MNSLKDLLVMEAQDMHSAETQLSETLPRMIEAAQSETLRRALAEHLDETRVQVTRVERALAAMGAPLGDDECEAMEGLVAEAEELMEEDLPREVLDAALIVAAQKAEHYEIAAYGSLAALARACGEDAAAALFEETLAEERRADALLTDIAANEVNRRAARAAQKVE